SAAPVHRAKVLAAQTFIGMCRTASRSETLPGNSCDVSPRSYIRVSGNLTAKVTHMTKGIVKFFNATKGYGFITPEDGSKDVFVHIFAVERSGLPGIAEGQRVSFEEEADPSGRGPQAVNLAEA